MAVCLQVEEENVQTLYENYAMFSWVACPVERLSFFPVKHPIEKPGEA
jgi:hypothetical protein